LSRSDGVSSIDADTRAELAHDDKKMTEIEDVAQQRAFDHLEAKIDIDSALTHLTDIELDVVKYHYGLMDGEQWSFPKIGDYFGFSATKARGLHNEAIKKLKKFFDQI
jgi:DNA-directed RNA polymerase sigma subunit (sigma70/sigma32)